LCNGSDASSSACVASAPIRIRFWSIECPQVLHAADVDQQRRRCQSQLQCRDQRVATGGDLGCFRITLQQIDCLSESWRM
jgi:hypothetical protein